MKKRTKIMAAVMAAAMTIGAIAPTAMAADFPEDTVNIICHAAAGGGSDAMARQAAQIMQDQLGWSVTVDNKTGGSGSVGMQYVMSSKADGYTIGTAPVELSMVEPLGYAEIGPDDVQLLGCAMSWPAALYVSADSEFNSLEDFVNYAKENPGTLQVANSGIGSIWHIAACVLADKAEIELAHVPYDGATGALTALLGKEIDAAIVGTAEGYSYVESGDLKCLAAFSEERSTVLPDTPTAKEQNFDVLVSCWVGFLAPKGIEEDVLNVLVDGIKTAFESEEYVSFCESRGCGSTYYGPEDFYKMVKADYDYYSELITSLNIGA
ncbi:MAG: tripartite tricarboxylate transporter substrate binding protein [Eubacteriales bacterium]|nr:tripartite tricarboxylate transporter substrate binding protein [Eubacteriales bacterium]